MVNVQKHKLLLSLLLCTIAGIFTACTDDTESIGNHNGTPLSINVGVDTPQSRAVITGNSLPEGSQIGVSVVDASGTDYQDQDYNNVCYQAVTEDGTQKWKVQSRSDILLSGEAGTLYAYYPWTAAATDFTQIAVNMDEAEQKDWMVAEPITNLFDAQATAAVKMKHMLTNFKLSFYKDNYSGKSEVTAVTIRSNAFATTGTLDATTGTFAAYGDGHALTRTFATTLGTDKTAAAACNVMVVPNTVAAPVTISVTVDGNTYSSVTSSLTLEKAKSYNYAMKLSSTGLSITEVTLTDWQTTDLGDTEFKPEQGSVSPWDNLANGVYAVSADDKPVAVDDADHTCIGVAVIVNEFTDYDGNVMSNKFMIEKMGEANQISISAAYTADNAIFDGEKTAFYWGPVNVEVTDIENMGSETGIMDEFTGPILKDFKGKANTAAIIATSDTDSYTIYANMGTYCAKFNATASENQGYTDWYIPSAGQMCIMYVYLNEINIALQNMSGTKISTEYHYSSYWTSSEGSLEQGIYFDFIDGGIVGNDNKTGEYKVRFIRDIK